MVTRCRQSRRWRSAAALCALRSASCLPGRPLTSLFSLPPAGSVFALLQLLALLEVTCVQRCARSGALTPRRPISCHRGVCQQVAESLWIVYISWVEGSAERDPENGLSPAGELLTCLYDHLTDCWITGGQICKQATSPSEYVWLLPPAIGSMPLFMLLNIPIVPDALLLFFCTRAIQCTFITAGIRCTALRIHWITDCFCCTVCYFCCIRDHSYYIRDPLPLH